MAKFSPMLEQYFGMKAKHPEAILLSRVGDFYEAYGEDAETIARALQIALTSKEAGAGQRVAMAGVPHHALAGYLA
jgi:DNA mismatch repair protein MutS